MHRSNYLLIGAVIGLLSTANGHANVIYQWHSTSPGQYVTAIDQYVTATGGELEFTNAAYFSGSVDFNVNDPETSPWVQYGRCPPGTPDNNDYCRITNSPVVSASLIFNEPASVYAQPGSQWFLENEFSFSSSITFNNDGTLSGDLSLEDESDVASAGGAHHDWNIGGYASDYFNTGECTGDMFCYGGSGYWQLASVTPVSEPPIWPLFGLGVLGLAGLVSLRRNARDHRV